MIGRFQERERAREALLGRVGGDTDGRGDTHVASLRIVIGGGDTGSDCIGTSIRQGALSVRPCRAICGSAPGSTTMNSSPLNLATMSLPRTHDCSACAQLRNTRSPTGVPWRSLMARK